MLCFTKLSGSEEVYGSEGGGSIKISFKVFLSDSFEKCHREPFSLSLISGIENVRMREWGRGGSVKIFRRICLFSECRKNSMLCFRKFLVAKKFMDKRVGEVPRFFSKNLCLTVPKSFVDGPFSESLVLSIEKIYASEGYVTTLRQKFFVSQHRNFS